MSKENNLKDYLTDLYAGIATKKPDASRNPQNFRAEIESIMVETEPNFTTLVTEANGTFTPDTYGADGFDKVVVTVPKSTFMAMTANKNGTYSASTYGKDGFDTFTVEVPEKILVEGSASANGIYPAPDGTDGFSSFEVNVPKSTSTFMSITVKNNGTYSASTYGKDGFDTVTVNVPNSGGSCSGNHIIEVEALPTENIDENALYKMGESYYKYSNAFKDILVVYNSTTMSIVEEYAALGMTFELYYVKTRPTEDIVVSNQSAMMLACYYVEDENDILAYGDLNGTGAYGWMSMITSMEAINGGAITSASQASQEGAMYALVEAGWKKYSSKNLIVEVDDLPTAGIEKTNLYKVDNTYFKYVITMVDLVVATNYGQTSLVAYYESKGYTVYLHYTENYNNLAPEDIIPTVKGATAGCYYDASRNDTFVYTNDLWVSLSTILAEEGLTFANGGAIQDASYARAGGYFAVINSAWQPLGADMYTGEVVIE